MDREFMLHKLIAAEVLPVRILNPTMFHVFVADAEGVLEIAQADHQPDRRTGPTLIGVTVQQCVVEATPVDFVSQPHQGVPGIEQLREVGLKELELVFVGIGLWLHFAS